MRMKSLVISVILLFVFGVANVSLAEGAEKVKIRVGGVSDAGGFQLRIAALAGIYEKYDIDAEILTFAFGIDTINAAIVGEADSALGLDYAVASRFSESNNLRIVAHLGGPAQDGQSLFARDIDTPEGLKGKKIAVQRGTANEYIWAKLFEKHNIDPKEVEHIYLTSYAEGIAAYESGEVDALWAPPEIEEAAKNTKGSKRLGDFALAGILNRGFLLLDEKFINENKDGVVRFLKALDEAVQFLKENPEKSAELLNKDLKIPVDAAVANIKKYRYELNLKNEDLDYITDVADWSIKNGLFKKAYNIRDFVYVDAIKEAFPDRVTVK
jgi:NitT/TauT family transport system substrate-binding protein